MFAFEDQSEIFISQEVHIFGKLYVPCLVFIQAWRFSKYYNVFPLSRKLLRPRECILKTSLLLLHILNCDEAGNIVSVEDLSQPILPILRNHHIGFLSKLCGGQPKVDLKLSCDFSKSFKTPTSWRCWLSCNSRTIASCSFVSGEARITRNFLKLGNSVRFINALNLLTTQTIYWDHRFRLIIKFLRTFAYSSGKVCAFASVSDNVVASENTINASEIIDVGSIRRPR